MLNTRFILALLELPGMGRRSVQAVLAIVHDDVSHQSELIPLLRKAQESMPRLRVPSSSELDEAVCSADRILERAAELHLSVIGKDHPDYPRRLANIPDPPVLLFVRGSTNALCEPKSVAVIGTREPSQWGATVGERLSQRIAEHGVVVVSGLAEGCDTAAHKGCLAANGKTVAVLAHGLHTIYPAKNRKLAEEIVERGGCLVSEYMPDARAQRSYFVERDRLQSALSDAVLVVETDVEGGTMHTVRACLAQRRILACLAHLPQFANDKSRGNEKLISSGEAMPIREGVDLEQLISRLGNEPVCPPSNEPAAQSDGLFSGI